jgi:glycosyltransferase involved in cell wall biosynthesis
MRKIGLYLDTISTGGIFQYNQSILDAVLELPSNQFETSITYTSDVWQDYLEKENIPATRIDRTFLSRIWFEVRIPLWLWRNYSKYFTSFTKSFIKEKCDLWIFPSQDIWSYCLPIKSLTTVHDLMHRYERKFSEAGSIKEYFFREIHYKRICKYSKGIIVDSELGKQQLIDSYNAEPTTIYPLPYIAPKYIFKDNNISIEKYNLPAKYLFYPAKFWTHKNHISIVKAVSILIEKIPDIKFVFVGARNNAYNSIVKMVDKYKLNNTFIFLDHVPDYHMRQLYKNARALVMPTFFGPTNIPPLEAFATGCPVAISNVYAMPEQVGQAGILFNPNSIEEIAEVIYNLWTDDILVKDLRKKGVAKSRSWRQKQFNSEFFKIVESIN